MEHQNFEFIYCCIMTVWWFKMMIYSPHPVGCLGWARQFFSSTLCWSWPLLGLHSAGSLSAARISKMASLKDWYHSWCVWDWLSLSFQQRRQTLHMVTQGSKRESRSWQASSTILCCQSKSQDHLIFKGRENKLQVLMAKADYLATIFAGNIPKLNINSFNFLQENQILKFYICYLLCHSDSEGK